MSHGSRTPGTAVQGDMQHSTRGTCSCCSVSPGCSECEAWSIAAVPASPDHIADAGKGSLRSCCATPWLAVQGGDSRLLPCSSCQLPGIGAFLAVLQLANFGQPVQLWQRCARHLQNLPPDQQFLGRAELRAPTCHSPLPHPFSPSHASSVYHTLASPSSFVRGIPCPAARAASLALTVQGGRDKHITATPR